MSSPILVRVAALGALSGIAAMAVASGACSSSSTGFATGGAGADGGKTDTDGGVSTTSSPCATTIQCQNPSADVAVLFSPMYSAYVTDDSSHSFQIPAVVKGVNASNGSSVTWGVSDPTAVSCVPDSMSGGIMITVKKPGNVTIVAQTSAGCGQSVLNVTAATNAQWQAGSARFNSDVPVYAGCIGLGGKKDYPDGGPSACPTTGPGCVQCHGAVPKNQYFQSVPNTPEQAGGFSDQQLIDIFTNGMVPPGGYFDNSIISPLAFSVFHRWKDVQGPEQQAMVVYLRSLTPIAEGAGNFGGGGLQDDGGADDGSSGAIDASTDATVEPTAPTCGAAGKCSVGDVCCVAAADKTDAGLVGTCGAASSCTGYALSCTYTGDCPSGQVCCGDLTGTPATAVCMTSCPSSDDQLCSAVTECPTGDACRGYQYGDGIKVCTEKTGDGGKGGKKDGG